MFYQQLLLLQLSVNSLPTNSITMNKLISITNNATKTFDEQLFSEFMKRVTIWDYVNISRENFLSLSHDDKEKIIIQYYFNI